MIDMDKKRNCYSCGKFGHLAKNCKKSENNKLRKEN